MLVTKQLSQDFQSKMLGHFKGYLIKIDSLHWSMSFSSIIQSMMLTFINNIRIGLTEEEDVVYAKNLALAMVLLLTSLPVRAYQSSMHHQLIDLFRLLLSSTNEEVTLFNPAPTDFHPRNEGMHAFVMPT